MKSILNALIKNSLLLLKMMVQPPLTQGHSQKKWDVRLLLRLMHSSLLSLASLSSWPNNLHTSNSRHYMLFTAHLPKLPLKSESSSLQLSISLSNGILLKPTERNLINTTLSFAHAILRSMKLIKRSRPWPTLTLATKFPFQLRSVLWRNAMNLRLTRSWERISSKTEHIVMKPS